MRRRLGALAAAVLATPFTAAAALPEVRLPSGHPCLLPEEGFDRLERAGGIEIRVARLGSRAAVVRASAALPAAPARVLALLADVLRWPRFLHRIRSLTTLPGSGMTVHVVLDAPWPFSDRDYAFAPAISRSAGNGGTVFWESASDRLPPPGRGVVRVEAVRGGFVVSPGTHPGTSLLVYSELDSFGETLPAFARRASWKRGPREIVQGIRALLAGP